MPAHARRVPAQPLIVPDTGNNRVLIYAAPSVNGQAANAVLGQPGFDSSEPGTSASVMSSPTAFAFDASGQLYVADTDNCRVLMFKPPFTSGKAASLVIGKDDFASSCSAPTPPPFPGPFAAPSVDDSSPSQANLGKTGGVAIDKRGGLWVSDSSNNRVLHFKAPLKSGQPADMVLGQSDFTSNGCAGAVPSSLCSPVGVAVDANGILWVADRGNNRVVAYIAPKSFAPIDFAIDGAESDLAAASPAVASRPLSLPSGVAAGPNDAIWVADTANNRVLMYTLSLATVFASKFGLDLFDVTPQLVLGQGDFFSPYSNRDSAPAANTMATPQGVVVAKDGSLWVGDTFNNRTLQFRPPFTNGMDASLVLGQQDFAHVRPNQGGTADAQTQLEPFDGVVALEAGPSPLAIAALLSLIGAWLLTRKLRRKTA